jgi:pre-mRNA-splicing factor CWC26
MRWGVGEVDEEEQRKESEHIEKESQRGFHAVYVEDLYEDRELQGRDRFGDPMSKLAKKKSKVRTFKGMQLLCIPTFIQFSFLGTFPANRFNVPPGWRWDGIDRSNGFEASIFKAANTRKANAEEAMYYAQDEM